MATIDAASQSPAAARGAPLYRLFWRWHFFAALLVIPFALWQSVTGSLYLWSYAWVDARYPDLRFVADAAPAQPPSAQLRAALADRADARVAEIRLPESTDRSTVVLLARNDGLVEPIFVSADARVLGALDATQWLPGLTRALHGGWPAGTAGSWLLELGDCWAIVMIASGLYLWWPRGIGWRRALWPRTDRGSRLFWRDLHACVAAWFALLILTFLMTALPWTAFWGGHVLGPVQDRFEQRNPAGFSPGGATAQQVLAAAPALDSAVSGARQRGVVGALQIRLGAAPGSPWWMHNVDVAPSADRTVIANAASGVILNDVAPQTTPPLARLIDMGVHLHQGDFGAINRWGNTAVALALMWMTVTGLVSWWRRRPHGAWGVPARSNAAWPRGLLVAAFVACVVLPLLGASVAALWAFDRTARVFARG